MKYRPMANVCHTGRAHNTKCSLGMCTAAHACVVEEGSEERAHGIREVDATPKEKSPFGTVLNSRLHGTHRPPGMLDSPAGHATQATAPMREEKPAGQMSQYAPLPAELVPALHSSQPEVVHTVGCWPAGQVVLAVPVQPAACAPRESHGAAGDGDSYLSHIFTT